MAPRRVARFDNNSDTTRRFLRESAANARLFKDPSGCRWKS